MKPTIVLFPFAGASFYSYRAFEEMCPSNIDLIILEAPGRGKRISENLVEDIHVLVDDLYQRIQNLNTDNLYFFGHSLGAVLAYLVTYKMKNATNSQPKRIVLSGKNPPHISGNRKNRHMLSDIDFKNMIAEMGGTPKEILENKDLLEFFLPILRSDFALIDTAKFKVPTEKLKIPAAILYGDSDKNTELASLKEWDRYLESGTKYYKFEGDHFFIFQHVDKMFDLILDNWNHYEQNLLPHHP